MEIELINIIIVIVIIVILAIILYFTFTHIQKGQYGGVDLNAHDLEEFCERIHYQFKIQEKRYNTSGSYTFNITHHDPEKDDTYKLSMMFNFNKSHFILTSNKFEKFAVYLSTLYPYKCSECGSYTNRDEHTPYILTINYRGDSTYIRCKTLSEKNESIFEIEIIIGYGIINSGILIHDSINRIWMPVYLNEIKLEYRKNEVNNLEEFCEIIHTKTDEQRKGYKPSGIYGFDIIHHDFEKDDNYELSITFDFNKGYFTAYGNKFGEFKSSLSSLRFDEFCDYIRYTNRDFRNHHTLTIEHNDGITFIYCTISSENYKIIFNKEIIIKYPSHQCVNIHDIITDTWTHTDFIEIKFTRIIDEVQP